MQILFIYFKMQIYIDDIAFEIYTMQQFRP